MASSEFIGRLFSWSMSVDGSSMARSDRAHKRDWFIKANGNANSLPSIRTPLANEPRTAQSQEHVWLPARRRARR